MKDCRKSPVPQRRREVISKSFFASPQNQNRSPITQMKKVLNIDIDLGHMESPRQLASQRIVDTVPTPTLKTSTLQDSFLRLISKNVETISNNAKRTPNPKQKLGAKNKSVSSTCNSLSVSFTPAKKRSSSKLGEISITQSQLTLICSEKPVMRQPFGRVMDSQSNISKFSTNSNDRHYNSGTKKKPFGPKWEDKEAEECTFHPNLVKPGPYFKKSLHKKTQSSISQLNLSISTTDKQEVPSIQKRWKVGPKQKLATKLLQSTQRNPELADLQRATRIANLSRVPDAFKKYRMGQDQADLNLMNYLNQKLNLDQHITETDQNNESSTQIN